MQRSSSDQSAGGQPRARLADGPHALGSPGGDAARVPPFAAAQTSPFAWDEPTDEEDTEGPEPAALQDWYRYIDSLARPPRRLQDELDLDEDVEADEGSSLHGDTETLPESEVGTTLAGGRAQRGAGPREGDHKGRPYTSRAHGESDLEEAIEVEEPRQPPYLSWGAPWTPPAATPLDDAAAQEIVAQLAPEMPEAPRVDWEPVSTEVPVRDLTEFIPALDAVEPPPRTREELLATVPAPPPAEPRPSEAAPGDAPVAASGFTAPAIEAGAAWQPPSSFREERATSAPTVTTTALVRVPTPAEEEGGTPGVTGRRGDGHGAPSEGRSRREEFLGRASARVETPAAQPVAASAASAVDLPSIATIRDRLPRHMERLLQVPTTEVAQNSYKSPFRETREDLIYRLLDPSLTLEEAARLLGVCPTTVRRYTNKGLLHHYRTPGNQRRFRLSDVLTFLDEHGTTWMLHEGDAEPEGEDDEPTRH
jgi:excisionase family DNA binding protein